MNFDPDPFSVELLQPRPDLDLSPRYDEGLDILLFESQAPRNWPHGGTVDGVFTLDLDPDRRLVHAEFIWPRHRWPDEPVPDGLRKPQYHGRHTLRLPHFSSASGGDVATVRVFQSLQETAISLNGTRADSRVTLGPGLEALLFSETLVGFVIPWPEAPQSG